MRDGSDITAAIGVATPVDPGQSMIEATAEGYEPWHAQVAVMGDGTTVTVEIPALEKRPEAQPPPDPDPVPVQLPPPPPPAPVDLDPGHGRRVLGLGLAAGGVAALGVAGAALQGFLRNPLADPGIIGVSPAASLGAVLALYTGISVSFPLALPLMGILGALLCALVLQGLARRGGVLTLVLAGVAVSSLCAAAMSLALNMSPNPYAAAEIMFWLMGSVTDRSMDHVWLAAPLMLLGWFLLALSARSLDALSLGEEAAAGLGVNVARTRTLVITGAAISVGAGTAVTGGIGFVGLVVPHVLRPIVSHKPSKLLLASALGGGVLLLAADILVRALMLVVPLYAASVVVFPDTIPVAEAAKAKKAGGADADKLDAALAAVFTAVG